MIRWFFLRYGIVDQGIWLTLVRASMVKGITSHSKVYFTTLVLVIVRETWESCRSTRSMTRAIIRYLRWFLFRVVMVGWIKIGCSSHICSFKHARILIFILLHLSFHQDPFLFKQNLENLSLNWNIILIWTTSFASLILSGNSFISCSFIISYPHTRHTACNVHRIPSFKILNSHKWLRLFIPGWLLTLDINGTCICLLLSFLRILIVSLLLLRSLLKRCHSKATGTLGLLSKISTLILEHLVGRKANRSQNHSTRPVTSLLLWVFTLSCYGSKKGNQLFSSEMGVHILILYCSWIVLAPVEGVCVDHWSCPWLTIIAE